MPCGEFYDFYSVSPEYFGYFLVCLSDDTIYFCIHYRFAPLHEQHVSAYTGQGIFRPTCKNTEMVMFIIHLSCMYMRTNPRGQIAQALDFVRWRLIFTDPQHRTYFESHFWSLAFWGGSQIFGKSVEPHPNANKKTIEMTVAKIQSSSPPPPPTPQYYHFIKTDKKYFALLCTWT
jgi:hypothetical protein